MPKNVNFRVVGLYFGWTGTTSSPNVTGPVTVDFEGETVQNLMSAVASKAAAGGINGVNSFAFSPVVPTPPSDIDRIIVSYESPPKRGLEPGNYVFQDSMNSEPQQVFQYYIYDENFQQLNRNGEFVPFTDPPPVPIPDNGYVIIRLVSIATRPVLGGRVRALSKRYNKALGH